MFLWRLENAGPAVVSYFSPDFPCFFAISALVVDDQMIREENARGQIRDRERGTEKRERERDREGGEREGQRRGRERERERERDDSICCVTFVCSIISGWRTCEISREIPKGPSAAKEFHLALLHAWDVLKRGWCEDPGLPGADSRNQASVGRSWVIQTAFTEPQFPVKRPAQLLSWLLRVPPPSTT